MLVKEFLKRVGERESNYYKVGDRYYCKRCNAEIQALYKFVPLHEGYTLFDLHVGSGKCHKIVIPYCPNCEKPFEVDCLDL